MKPQNKTLLKYLDQFSRDCAENSGINHLVKAYEYALAENVSISPIRHLWREHKNLVPATVSTDRLFRFICRLQASNNWLRPKKRVNRSEDQGIDPSEHEESAPKDEELEAFTKQVEGAVKGLEEMESQFQSSSAYPFAPAWFLEEENLKSIFADSDNPVTVITDYLKLVYVDSYSTDEKLSFFAKDAHFELTDFEKDFFCELIGDLLTKIEDQNIVGFLEIIVFNRYDAFDFDWEDWDEDSSSQEYQEYLAGQKRFQDLICASDQYSQAVFSAVMHSALKMRANFDEGEVVQLALDHFLEKPIGRCEPYGIPIAYVQPLLDEVSFARRSVDFDLTETFIKDIKEANSLFGGGGRSIFTMGDASMISLCTPRNFEAMLPAAVQFGRCLTPLIGMGRAFSDQKVKTRDRIDEEFKRLVEACADEKFFRLANATTAVWILLAIYQLEGKFPRWERIAEVIEKLENKPGFSMVKKSLGEAYLVAIYYKELLTVQLVEPYVDITVQSNPPPRPIPFPERAREPVQILRTVIEDGLKDSLGELYQVVSEDGWRTYVDAHLKFKKTQGPGTLGDGITEWGNICGEFAKIFEIELGTRLKAIYESESYRRFKWKRHDKTYKSPTLGHYLYMLGKEYRELPDVVKKQLDQAVRIQHDEKLIKELQRFNKQVRNKGFHTEHVPQSEVHEAIEVLHGVKGKPGLLARFLKSLTASSSKRRQYL